MAHHTAWKLVPVLLEWCLDPCSPTDLSAVTEMFSACAVPFQSPVADERWKCG